MPSDFVIEAEDFCEVVDSNTNPDALDSEWNASMEIGSGSDLKHVNYEHRIPHALRGSICLGGADDVSRIQRSSSP